MQAFGRTMRWLLVALMLLCVSVQAYEHQQAWLDGSLDPDAAMALLERDTDGPLALIEERAVQVHDAETETDADAGGEAESEAEAEGAVEAEAEHAAEADQEAEPLMPQEEHAPEGEALVEADSQAEEGGQAEGEAENKAEAEAAPAAEQETPAGPTAADLEAAMPALMEMAASARAASRARAGAQWRNGPPRRRRHRSIRAERERAFRQQREDAIYAENLRKLAVRREKWSLPKQLPQALQHAAEQQLQRKGLRKDAEGFMTAEEAQVESLLQMHEKPMVTLHHTNNVHAKLTPDALHGTGLFNKANRAATVAGLAASADNHPPAPAFVPLPPVNGAPQAKEYSFVVQKEQARPAYAGPQMQDLPPVAAHAHAAPAPAHPAAAAPVAAHSAEEEFVRGLPAEFLELDAATQVRILAMVDAGVDVGAESKTKAAAKAAAKSEAKAASTAHTEAKAAAKVGAQSSASSIASVDESELADAASALKALAALQRESHVPFAKLVHLLAKGKQ